MGRFILVTTSLFHYYILNMWGNIVYLFQVYRSLNQEEPREDLLQRLAKDPIFWIWMRLFGCLLWKDGRVRELSVQKGRKRIFVIKTLLFYLFERFTTPPCRCLYIPNSLKSGMAMWLSMAKKIWKEMNSMIFPRILRVTVSFGYSRFSSPLRHVLSSGRTAFTTWGLEWKLEREIQPNTMDINVSKTNLYWDFAICIRIF